ncbi:MAG: hypothetical protein K5685_12345 [Bacteroidales bacterium]|nr:hypothetical protein [Bacteroidales bacterium]
MAKDINFNGNLDYKISTDNYYLQMGKTKKFPWWVLLFLLPLLLLIKCNKEISVNCYDSSNNNPLQGQNVTLEYVPHFIFSNGNFFPSDTLKQTKTTDTDGYVLFDSLPCSVFSYIFFNGQKVTASSFGECQSEHAEESKFHFTNHIDLFLKCPEDILPPPVEEYTVPERDEIPEDSLRGESGNLRFNLQWQSKTDLDLYVIDPCSDTVYYKKKTVTCNGNTGTLDIDANANDDKLILDPQENIFYETPSKGVYKVLVSCYAWRETTSSPLNFNVTIIDKNGRKDFAGEVTKAQRKKYLMITEYVSE